jgi:hypothetical protein
MGTLHGDLCTHMIVSLRILLRMRNVLRQKQCGKCLEIILKNMVEPGRPQMSVYDNMAHALCVLDN